MSARRTPKTTDPRAPGPPGGPLAGRRVLLGVSGGIAAYKSVLLTRLLMEAGAEVQVVLTEAATHFVGSATFAGLTGRRAYHDLWEEPETALHVRLAHEADLVIVAPATANTLAKLGLGFADDLLSCTVLEATCPVLVAPAMHTGMYTDPSTQENLRLLAGKGARIVGPASGPLAAGDEGLGRMSEPDAILAEAESVLGRGRDLDGARIVITAGPTWEPVDPVRFIGNRSTGKMGFAIAAEARDRGADVTLILGPGTHPPPPGVRVVPVTTAVEMRAETLPASESADAVIMAAAVADFRPKAPADEKLKKDRGVPTLELEPNPDILAELGAERQGDLMLVGFAAETTGEASQMQAVGRDKLERKHLDLIVVNEVGRPGTGFGADTARALIVDAAGDDAPLRDRTKADLARELCDRVAKRFSSR